MTDIKITLDVFWEPHTDITLHELATCIPILVARMDDKTAIRYIQDLEDEARRHFRLAPKGD